MIDIPRKCIEEHQGAELVCEENHRKMIFHKSAERIAEKIQIDKCVPMQGKRCDYLVRDWKNRHHFVELKGRKVMAAFDQLEASIPQLVETAPHLRPQIWCFIVCSKYPQVPKERTGYQNRQTQLKKRWNAETRVMAQVGRHELTDD